MRAGTVYYYRYLPVFQINQAAQQHKKSRKQSPTIAAEILYSSYVVVAVSFLSGFISFSLRYTTRPAVLLHALCSTVLLTAVATPVLCTVCS